MEEEKRTLRAEDVFGLFRGDEGGCISVYPDIKFTAERDGSIVAKWTDGEDVSLVHQKTFSPYEYFAEVIGEFFKDVKAHHEELPF